MWNVTLRGLLAHKTRLLLTAFAVLLGVAFMAGTRVLADTLDSMFNDLYSDVNRNVDATERQKSDLEALGITIRGRVSDAVRVQVGVVSGAEAAVGTVSGYASVLGSDGKPVNKLGQGAPSIGYAWDDNATLNPMHLVAGTAPSTDDEVVIDKGSADRGHLAVGDRTTVLTKNEPTTVRISGIAKFGTADSPLGAQLVLFKASVAQRLLGAPNQWDAINVVAKPGVSQQDLVAQITKVVPPTVEAISGKQLTKETQSNVRKSLSFFNTLLLVFVLIALFVACFIINNTFSIIVAQRTKELALLRAIGASRRQVLGSVLVEALIVATVSSVIGLFAGVGLAVGLEKVIGAFGIDLPPGSPVIRAGTVVLALVVGIGVTVVMALLPAYRASSTPPIAALRDVALDRSASSRTRAIVGAVLTALCVGALIAGLAAGDLAIVGLGAFGTFIGLAVLGPVLARPLSRVIGAPLPRLRGVTGSLARANASRSPKRTAATASALMVGLGLVVFFTVFAQSAKTSVNRTVDENFRGDFVMNSNSQGFGGLSPNVAKDVGGLPEIAAVTGIRLGFLRIDGKDASVAGIDPSTANDLFDVGVIHGSVAGLDANGLAIDDSVAEDKGWTVGTIVPVEFAQTGKKSLIVRAVYTEDQMAGKYVVGHAAFDANFPDPLDIQVYAAKKASVSMAEARAALNTVVAKYPTATLQDRSEFKADMAKQVNQLLGFVYVMLAFAVLIAFFGIANTLALSIIERTREIGVLRAVGMGRSQVRSAIRWEAVIIALIGTALGVIVGLVFSVAVVRAMHSQGLVTWDVPVVQLVFVAVLAAVLAVAMAIMPARRAAKLDVLRAIASS